MTSIIIGKPSASPAKDSVPSCPTYQASAIKVAMVTTIESMFGAAKQMMVRPIGAVSSGDECVIVLIFSSDSECQFRGCRHESVSSGLAPIRQAR